MRSCCLFALNLDQSLFNESTIVLSQDRQLACLSLHGGVPHVSRAHGLEKVHAVVSLENREPGGIGRVRWLNTFRTAHQFGFERWIEGKLKSGLWKELRQSLEI